MIKTDFLIENKTQLLEIYQKERFFNNAGNQPNTRKLVKFFEKLWGEKIDAKVLYDLFPGDPSKQGGRISGLPESRRKGGY